MNENFNLIKTKLDIMDVIQEDVTLRKSGKTYQANCPFHDDRSPSFTVWPDEQKFKCFGCGEHGDVIDYIQKRENIPSVLETMRFVSNKYNITLQGFDEEYYKRKHHDIQRKRQGYVPYYKKRNIAYEYLQARRISEEVGGRFQIGFNEKNHSLTIPIKNTYGELIGMAERFLKPDSPIKYKNSSESEFFKKSDVLFGLSECRKDIDKEVYIVEGYFDVLAMYEFGIGKTVGYAGQAITESQSKLLSNYITKETKIYLIPDKDLTGQNFIKKNIKSLRLYNKNRIAVIDLPEGKDINDYLLMGGQFEDLPVISCEMFLLKQDLNKCADIEDEYEVSKEYAKGTDNKMIRADMAEYLSKRWKKPIELVREHMNSDKQVSDYSRKLYTATEAFNGYKEMLKQGDDGKLFTGLRDVDRHIKGIEPGKVLTIIGRSGAGKTTFILNLIYNAVFNQKFNIIFNSLELNKENVIPQFLQIRKQEPINKVEKIVLSETHDKDIEEVLQMMDKHLRIADEDSQTIHDLEQYIIAANDSVFDEPVKAIFVDYFQYMKPDERAGKQRHEKMAEIARGFKALAKRQKIVVVALSQANREDGKDGSERLTKSSAGDTRAVEESSDYLFGIRRSAANTKLSEEERQSVQHEMYCQILKNRWGFETEIPLYFEGMTKRIENADGRVTLKSKLDKEDEKKKGRKN